MKVIYFCITGYVERLAIRREDPATSFCKRLKTEWGALLCRAEKFVFRRSPYEASHSLYQRSLAITCGTFVFKTTKPHLIRGNTSQSNFSKASPPSPLLSLPAPTALSLYQPRGRHPISLEALFSMLRLSSSLCRRSSRQSSRHLTGHLTASRKRSSGKVISLPSSDIAAMRAYTTLTGEKV